MTKEKNKGGRPTKYTKELAQQIANELTHTTIRKACKKCGIDAETYYNWIYKYDEFFELSSKARRIKGIYHLNESEEILEMAKDENMHKDEDVRSDILRLRCDFHMRLAGKCNQNLFGDQARIQVDKPEDFKDVDVPQRPSQEEWLKNNEA